MTIIPVILRCSKQAAKVDRLVQYCKELDGTELVVVKVNPKDDPVPHPVGTELGIRQVAKEFRDRHFIWLEADAAPIKAGWLQAITEEYEACGKPFMMPDLSGGPFYDVASAIGVYPPNYFDMLPTNFNKPPWFDLWLTKHHADKVHFSKTIQHRYGLYDGTRVVRRYAFPGDKNILRPETVLFHADPTQSIIRGGLKQAFYHSGDLGDIVAAMPIIKQQGGGHLLIGPAHQLTHGKNPRESLLGPRYEALKPLLLSQPYIHSVRWENNHKIAERDLSTFRFTTWNRTDNLAEWQARHLGRTELSMEPWLELDAPWTGDILMSRTSRYHNPLFPWCRIIEKYGDRLKFIGLPHEHQLFKQTFRCNVKRINTPTLIDAAKAIAGSAKLFTNQTVMWWIAAGLGKLTFQESWNNALNSVIDAPYLYYTRTREELDHVEQIVREDN